MAIYHLHVKVIGRKAGSSAVASAAYRSASRLRDERIGPGGDHQFAKLLHLAGFQFPRLVFQRLQFRIVIPWFAHHRLHKLLMER